MIWSTVLRLLQRSAAVLFWIACAIPSGCREQGGTFAATDDAGASSTCTTSTDCGGSGVCVAGVCQAVTACNSDGECAAQGKVCHMRRFYCVDCDGTHSNECASGQTCQFDFTCVAIGSGAPDAGQQGGSCAGLCSTRGDCSAERVCRSGTCCVPPARCLSPDDCPSSRPECNGATGECFGGQDECGSDVDCQQGGAYVGKFCNLTTQPRQCVTAPSCGGDADCASSGLVCDLAPGSPSLSKCVNGTPCPTGNECNSTTQVCVNRVCASKTCMNFPSVCDADEICNNTTGQCVPSQGGTCAGDEDCQQRYFCNTASTPGVCELGCRGNGDCPGGICNASHRCEAAQGGICGTCNDSSECPAGTRCIQNPLTGGKVCYEGCSSQSMVSCSDPMSLCLFGNCSCFL